MTLDEREKKVVEEGVAFAAQLLSKLDGQFAPFAYVLDRNGNGRIFGAATGETLSGSPQEAANLLRGALRAERKGLSATALVFNGTLSGKTDAIVVDVETTKPSSFRLAYPYTLHRRNEAAEIQLQRGEYYELLPSIFVD